MTPKQAEKLRSKIADIKKVLATEKRKFGGYHDGRGLRYLPTRYFVQLGDYAGGLTYTKWFSKSFPDDAGFPDFLFEWTIILFKSGQIERATQKAFQTFASNTSVFDKFFELSTIPTQKWEGSNLDNQSFLAHFPYNCKQPELENFASWLRSFLSTEPFIQAASQLIELKNALNNEDDIEKRSYLVEQIYDLVEGNNFIT